MHKASIVGYMVKHIQIVIVYNYESPWFICEKQYDQSDQYQVIPKTAAQHHKM